MIINLPINNKYMQNIPNNSNQKPASLSQAQSVEHLQRHIVELTAYINENNQKYHRNMVTLKQFYEEQGQQLQDQKQNLLNDNTQLNNQVLTLRDLLSNANLRVRQLQELLHCSEVREEEIRDRLQRQRQRNQAIYLEVQNHRKVREEELQSYKMRITELEDQNRGLSGELSKQETNIDSLTQKKHSLQSAINENYLLPSKITDLQKDHHEFKLKMIALQTKNKDQSQQINTNEINLSKLRTQNEALRIFKINSNNEKKIDIEQQKKEQKQYYDVRVLKLEKENQRYLYQLNQVQSRVKVLGGQNQCLQREVKKLLERNGQKEGQVRAVDRQKQDYLVEFGLLKVEYEAVIQKLEDTLITYQQKNWNLEQQNKDLNGQLTSLHQLLNQVKSLNNLQVHRPEYRRMAEMEILAQREIPLRKEDKKVEVEQGDTRQEWQKLMKDIEQISV